MFCLYADHSIKLTSNDSWKNMNEQDQDDYWYKRWLSSIFLFQSSYQSFYQSLFNCSFKQENRDRTEEFNLYSNTKEIYLFCHHLTQREVIFIQ